MKTRALSVLLPVAAILFAGCQSSIRPLLPLQRVEVWQAGDGTLHPLASTQPAATEMASTAPATQLASTEPGTELATQPTTQPTTQPAGQVVVRVIDPNETGRFIYQASYDNVWKQASQVLHRMGFELDRQDYRDGVMITKALPSSQIVEPWKPQQVSAKDALENTINDQRRTIRVTIEADPGKPDFYKIAVQVLVERQTNPSGEIGGPIFVEGSGFGRNNLALRSDYASTTPNPARWNVIGHDTDMEKKVLTRLFRRI